MSTRLSDGSLRWHTSSRRSSSRSAPRNTARLFGCVTWSRCCLRGMSESRTRFCCRSCSLPSPIRTRILYIEPFTRPSCRPPSEYLAALAKASSPLQRPLPLPYESKRSSTWRLRRSCSRRAATAPRLSVAASTSFHNTTELTRQSASGLPYAMRSRRRGCAIRMLRICAQSVAPLRPRPQMRRAGHTSAQRCSRATPQSSCEQRSDNE